MTQRFLSAAKYMMQQINPANLSGAIDVVIVEQEDGKLLCSPFHVRFGKLGTLIAEGRPVDVYINGELVPDLRMKLGYAGEAFFVEERRLGADERPENPAVLTSPITSDVEDEDDDESHWRLNHAFSETDLPKISSPPLSSKKRRQSLNCDTISDTTPQLNIRCFSDDELCPDVFNESSRFLSDTSLDQACCGQDAGKGLTWQWGELPVEEHIGGLRRKKRLNRRSTVAVVETSALSDSDTGPDEAADEAEDEDEEEKTAETDKKEEPEITQFYVENSKEEDGPGPTEPIYLSEVIERPELRDHYVYRRPQDAAVREGAISPVDQGYRSDGEGSPAIGWSTGHQGSPPSPGRLEEELSARLFPVHLSLCGMGEQVDEEGFKAHMVLYEEFCQDPEAVLANPNLVVQLNGRHYSWPVAAPLLVASLVYQSDLPPRVVEKMVQKQEEKRESKRRGSYFARWTTGWGRSRTSQPTLPASTESQMNDKSASKDDEAPTLKMKTEDIVETPPSPVIDSPPLLHFKTLRLSSEQLLKLKLRPGVNSVEYRVTSQFQGTARCHARIFLWHWRDKVVISDIDGTITQSDVMGQLGPFLGRDVSQRGVASLYSNIASNRYRVLYLSSRAIGQAHWTRNYLDSVVQEKGAKLPEGPLLLSPTSLLFALVREIRNRPEDFKIPCLKDVRSLFPENTQPFYAGFGNKVNDVRSYEAVGIDPERIFVVDTTGALRKHSHVAYKTTYSNLGELVHHFFPDGEEENEFSNFVYWRTPLANPYD